MFVRIISVDNDNYHKSSSNFGSALTSCGCSGDFVAVDYWSTNTETQTSTVIELFIGSRKANDI